MSGTPEDVCMYQERRERECKPASNSLARRITTTLPVKNTERPFRFGE
jgi:hypothetical protein